LIDQERINRHPVTVVGVGAIGSHLAEMLAKLGVPRFPLIDPDEIDTVNLSVQGFYETEVGQNKADAVAKRIGAISGATTVSPVCGLYSPEMIESGAVVFACVDSIRTRRTIFRDFCRNDWTVLLDGRMAAESLQAFCVRRCSEPLDRYQATLFPAHEARRESCTARSTIYCAAMAAAVLCSMFKQWAMGQEPEEMLQFDLLAMDCFR